MILWFVPDFADDVGKIATGHLQRALTAGEVVQLLGGQTDADLSLYHSNCGRSGSFGPHNGLHLLCCAALKQNCS